MGKCTLYKIKIPDVFRCLNGSPTTITAA